jgi:hypothetical protein
MPAYCLSEKTGYGIADLPILIIAAIQTFPPEFTFCGKLAGDSPTSAARQVDNYALNLACFHEYSQDRTIVPLVIADSRVASNNTRTEFDTLIEPCHFASTSNAGRVLQAICAEYVSTNELPIDTD